MLMTRLSRRHSLPSSKFRRVARISTSSPAYSDYSDKDQLPSHALRQVRCFFQDYKVLENKQVVPQTLLGPAEAIVIISDALELYRKLRRGERK